MGAPELLRHLRESGFTIAPAEGGGIRVAPSSSLTDADRQAIRDHRAELLSLLATPPLADPDRYCWPHSDAMSSAELNLFARRVAQFNRLGVPANAAEAIADRLVFRDRQLDDRRVCIECASLRSGRCLNFRLAGLNVPDVGRESSMRLQRCGGFTWA